MEKNNLFSLNRFMNLFRQSLIVNMKLIGISIAGVAGVLFIFLMFCQRNFSYTRWDQGDYMVTFFVFSFIAGIIWTGKSFPAFRSKEKSISYLMLPASRLEKFIFELLIRIVAFILLMPLLFWIVANIEGAMLHHFKPELASYTFSYSEGWAEFAKSWHADMWIKFGYSEAFLFFLIAGFTGGCYFSKSPLVKTIFIFLIIVCGYFFLIYLLVKGLKIDDYLPTGRTILPLHNKEQNAVFFAIASAVVNLTLLSVSWFRFKEREA
jgi:hypothetical protein